MTQNLICITSSSSKPETFTSYPVRRFLQISGGHTTETAMFARTGDHVYLPCTVAVSENLYGAVIKHLLCLSIQTLWELYKLHSAVAITVFFTKYHICF